MSTPSTIPDTMLIAYLDGELDAAGLDAVEAAMAADPAVVERLETHAALATRVHAAFAPVLDEPVPAGLTALLSGGASGGKVVDLAARRAPKARPAWMGWAAMAACLAIGLVVGVAVPHGSGLVGKDMAARGPLAGALETRLASATGDDPVKIGTSFRDRQDRYCRTFTAGAQGVSGLACREDTGWKVQLAVAQAPTAQGDFRQAASETPAPVLALMDDLIAGDPLDAEQEAAARAKGWK